MAGIKKAKAPLREQKGLSGVTASSNYGVSMTKPCSPYQDKLHKDILRTRYLTGFAQPGRFRAELDKVKQMLKGKAHG